MLVINRDSGYVDKIRSYNIYIDGISSGTIADGESKALDVSNGEHEVYLKIDWVQSNKLIVNTNTSKDTEIEAKSSLRGIRILLGILYLTIFSKRYIKLELNS